MNKRLIFLRVLALMHLVPVAFSTLVAGFADGGGWLERALLGLVHPITALFILVLVLSRDASPLLVRMTTGLAALNVIADVAMAAAIGTGAVRGYWWLPLMFALVPLIVLSYCYLLLRQE